MNSIGCVSCRGRNRRLFMLIEDWQRCNGKKRLLSSYCYSEKTLFLWDSSISRTANRHRGRRSWFSSLQGQAWNFDEKNQPHRDVGGNTGVKVTRTNGSSSSSTSSTSYSQESVDATKLVDDLLEYTKSLMMVDHGVDETRQEKRKQLQHVIAYSGGIDSSVVAALVHHVATSTPTIDNDNNHHNKHHVRAVLGLSPAVPTEQIVLAEQVAQHIGIQLDQIPTSEGSDQLYIENSGQACLACKTHLYTCLESIVQHLNGNGNDEDEYDATISTNHNILFNGTNADDLLDPTRLGLIAADQHNVKSPLRYTTKREVRIVGRHLGLPNWNYAASPCLRSRLAIGVHAIPEHLQRIERAERFVRQCLEIDATKNLRVRLLTENRAMIEVEYDNLDEAKSSIKTKSWQTFFVDELQFASVDVRQFKSGSVAPKADSNDVPKNLEFDASVDDELQIPQATAAAG